MAQGGCQAVTLGANSKLAGPISRRYSGISSDTLAYCTVLLLCCSEQQRCDAGAGRCGAPVASDFALVRAPELWTPCILQFASIVLGPFRWSYYFVIGPTIRKLPKDCDWLARPLFLHVAPAASTLHQPIDAAPIMQACIPSIRSNPTTYLVYTILRPNARYYSSTRGGGKRVLHASQLAEATR